MINPLTTRDPAHLAPCNWRNPGPLQLADDTACVELGTDRQVGWWCRGVPSGSVTWSCHDVFCW